MITRCIFCSSIFFPFLENIIWNDRGSLQNGHNGWKISRQANKNKGKGSLTSESSSYVLEIPYDAFTTLNQIWLAAQHSVKSTASYWLVLENNEKATLSINMPYWVWLCGILILVMEDNLTSVISLWEDHKRQYGEYQVKFSSD